VFDTNNYREKSRPLNGPYQVLDTIIEDDHHLKSTEGGVREGSPTIKKNMSAMQFSQLSFKDRMMDHRKTNFPMGNKYSNEFSPTNDSRAQRSQLDNKYRTIDVGFMNESVSSPLGAGGRNFNLEAA
jgi:hypothetical protein